MDHCGKGSSATEMTLLEGQNHFLSKNRLAGQLEERKAATGGGGCYQVMGLRSKK